MLLGLLNAAGKWLVAQQKAPNAADEPRAADV